MSSPYLHAYLHLRLRLRLGLSLGLRACRLQHCLRLRLHLRLRLRVCRRLSLRLPPDPELRLQRCGQVDVHMHAYVRRDLL